MPKRTRSSRSRRSTRRRTAPVRTWRRSIVAANIVTVKRKVTLADVTFNIWQSQAYAPLLSQLPNYTEFTNLFEQYRINGIKLDFIPKSTSFEANTSASVAIMPRLYTIIDKDGNAQTSSETAMQQYGNARLIRDPSKPFSIYIKKPCVQFGTANTITIVGGAPKASPWLDCDNFNVQHWGCAIGGIMPTGTGSVSFSVVATYYMQFKHVV